MSRDAGRPTAWKEKAMYHIVDNLRRPWRFAAIAIAALAIVVAAYAPSQARGGGGHSFGGGHPSRGFVHRGFEGHHHFDRFRHGHFVSGFGPVYPYYGYYPYEYDAPAYWYYCPSYGAYYPNVASCPETWVPVPAS